MSFQEFAANTEDTQGSQEPLVGQSASLAETLVDGDAVKKGEGAMKVKYIFINIADNGDRVLGEDIMTRSLLCAGSLRKVGDVIVLREDHAFNKDGDYLVAIKYVELVGP
jgi:hypothetical protein